VFPGFKNQPSCWRLETGTDVLEDIALQRAKDKSDTLLIFLLKACRPGKYKDRAVREVKGEIKQKHLSISHTEAFIRKVLGEDTKKPTPSVTDAREEGVCTTENKDG